MPNGPASSTPPAPSNGRAPSAGPDAGISGTSRRALRSRPVSAVGPDGQPGGATPYQVPGLQPDAPVRTRRSIRSTSPVPDSGAGGAPTGSATMPPPSATALPQRPVTAGQPTGYAAASAPTAASTSTAASASTARASASAGASPTPSRTATFDRLADASKPVPPGGAQTPGGGREWPSVAGAAAVSAPLAAPAPAAGTPRANVGTSSWNPLAADAVTTGPAAIPGAPPTRGFAPSPAVGPAAAATTSAAPTPAPGPTAPAPVAWSPAAPAAVPPAPASPDPLPVAPASAPAAEAEVPVPQWQSLLKAMAPPPTPVPAAEVTDPTGSLARITTEDDAEDQAAVEQPERLRRPLPFTWLQWIILAVVAFVLGFLIIFVAKTATSAEGAPSPTPAAAAILAASAP